MLFCAIIHIGERGTPSERGALTVVFHYCDTVGVGVNEVGLGHHSYRGNPYKRGALTVVVHCCEGRGGAVKYGALTVVFQ